MSDFWDDAAKARQAERDKLDADKERARAAQKEFESAAEAWRKRFFDSMESLILKRREAPVDDKPVYERLGPNDARVRTGIALVHARVDLNERKLLAATNGFKLDGSENSETESFELVKAGPSVTAIRRPTPRDGDGTTPEDTATAVLRTFARFAS